MNILWITPIRFGDTIHQVGEIGTASALIKKGWNIDFLSAEGNPNAQKFMSELGFKLFQVPMSRLPGAAGISFNNNISKKIPLLLEKNNYDVIMVEWQAALGFLKFKKSIIAKNMTIPPWLFEDRSPPANKGIVGRLQWLHYDKAWKSSHIDANEIEVLVPGLEKFVKNRFSITRPMIYCPSGVEIDRFQNSSKPLGGIIKFVYHGSLDKGRGLDKIIKFGIKLSNENYKFNILIFGVGPLSKYFSKMSNKYSWLEFKGRVDYSEVPILLSEQDIGLLPLPDELPWNVGSPLKAMEYAASGLITLATDVDGSIPFMNYNWFFCGPKENPIDRWIEHIEYIFSEPMQFISLRGAARRDAEKFLTWDVSVIQLDKALRQLLND